MYQTIMVPLDGSDLAECVFPHVETLAQLDRFNRYEIMPLERFKVLELLIGQVGYLQGEMAKKFTAKHAPLEAPEQAAWNVVDALWRALGEGYQRCLQALVDGNSDLVDHGAAIALRCLQVIGLRMLEYYRTYLQLPPALWRQLYMIYGYAEKRAYLDQPVMNPLLEKPEETTCEGIFVKALLVHLADPYQLTPRQLAQAVRWLDKWSMRVAVLDEPPANLAKLSPIALDIKGDQPPLAGTMVKSRTVNRYLDNAELAASLRKRIKFLRNGGSPAKLDLGEDCVQPSCETFLTALYKHWCEVDGHRAFERRASAAKALTASGLAGIHFYVSEEKPFKQPGHDEDITWQEAQDLKMFGRVSNHTQKLSASQLGYALENWQIVDESAMGFCLRRPIGQGGRLAHHQLVAVKPPDSPQFVIGVIRWLQLTLKGELHMGVCVMPGMPKAIAARGVSLNLANPNRYTQIFWLPALPALNQPPSLVIPSGWYQPKKHLQLYDNKEIRVEITGLIERGSDYERVTYLNLESR